MEKSWCILICFLSAVTFGYSQLFCYDCDPLNGPEQCQNPANSSARTTNCNAVYPEANSTNATILCVTAFLNYTGVGVNNTGIYRGCELHRQDVANFCDWFGQENNTQNRTVTACATCNSTRCNTQTFNADGTMNSSGITLTNNIIFALVLSIIFCTISF